MSFSELNLHPFIVRNLETMGYREPRAIQSQAAGSILEGRDVIGLAPTGTGKTAAFLAPLAHCLLTEPPPRKLKGPTEPMSRLRALVLCPTRELAQQVADEAAAICQGTVLRTACAYGKVAITPQAEVIARGIDLLVATPGRVRELLEADLLSLAYVRHVAIDEADRMLDLGFLPQVSAILEGVSSKRQTLLFTATFPKEIAELAERFLKDPVRIEIGEHTTPAQHVKQHLLSVAEHDKVALLLHLIKTSPTPRDKGVLIFCRTKRRVGWVGSALQRHGISLGMIHGDRTQAQRQRALSRFAKGELAVVVATDVAARGLHIPAARTVINYDLPLAAEEFVHRIGRAGHGGGFGEALTLLDDRDASRWREIARIVGRELVPTHAEKPDGFTPPPPPARVIAKKVSGTKQSTTKTGSAVKQARFRPTPTRSKKSRPIKPGQKPGGGVRKPKPGGA